MAFLGLLLVAAAQSVVARGSLSPSSNVLDYRVVACGERAVLQGADPYLVEPLRTCEHRLAPVTSDPAWAATPFCLPPYAAALLAPFGALPFSVGLVVWFALIVLATCLTAAAVGRMLGRPAPLVALVLAPTVGLLNLHLGETVPFAIAAVAVGGLALQRNAPKLAALAVAAAFIEPAIGLPAAVGLATLAPKARLPLALALAALGVISFGAFGVARNIEYAFRFLPAHERAEVIAGDQYSLTHLAYILGAPAHLASLLGSISYAAAIAVGVWLAARCAAKAALPALVVLLPVATSMLGGPFVHNVEIAAALPAAMLLARDSRLARLAVTLLAVQWGLNWHSNVVPVVAATAGISLLYFGRLSLPKRAAFALGVVGLILGINHAAPHARAYPEVTLGEPEPAIVGTDLSSLAWEWRIKLAEAGPAFDRSDPLRKLPTWAGLALLPLSLARYSVRPGRRRRDTDVAWLSRASFGSANVTRPRLRPRASRVVEVPVLGRAEKKLREREPQ